MYIYTPNVNEKLSLQNIFILPTLHGNSRPNLNSGKILMATIPTISSSSASLISHVIQINSSTQLPLKLTSSNFPSWHLQHEALLTGLDLIRYVNGDNPCPNKTIFIDDKDPKPNPAYSLWIRQDKLILHATLSSLSKTVIHNYFLINFIPRCNDKTCQHIQWKNQITY